jgi:hypothetical protein
MNNEEKWITDFTDVHRFRRFGHGLTGISGLSVELPANVAAAFSCGSALKTNVCG